MPPLETSPSQLRILDQPHGNMEALGRAFDELAPGLLTLALHITRCPELAEDMVQEVFLEELTQGQLLSSETSLEARLMVLLAKRLDSFELQGKNEPRVLGLEEAEALPARWTPLSEIQQAENLDQLNIAIDLLPERYREVVRLSLVESRNSQEIGIQLNRSPATVRSQLARGLDRLRHSLPGALGVTLLCATTGHSTAATLGPADALRATRARFLTQAAKARATYSSPIGTTAAMTLKWIALLVLGLGFGFWVTSSKGEALAPVTASDKVGATQHLQPRNQTLLSPAVGTSGRRNIPASETLASANKRAHVFGTVVGPDGKGIKGALVTLFTWNEWDSPEGAPEIKGEGTFGWRIETGPTGDFSFDAQVPKSGRPNLHVEAGSGFTVADIWFDTTFCNQAPLWPGENKLGSVQLHWAGSLSGTLLTDEGLPAYPAHIAITPGAHAITGSLISTARDGTFQLDHILAGQQEFVAQYEGQVRVTEPLIVERGAAQDLKTFRMPKAPLLPVLVTDFEGFPLQGAVLKFAPLNAKSADNLRDHGLTTDAQGRRNVRVRNYKQTALFVSLDGFASEKPYYRPKPNQAVLEVHMHRTWKQTFKAVDANTGEALSGFTLVPQEKIQGEWVGSRASDSTTNGETGAKVISIQDGEWVNVRCPGYESTTLDPRASVDGTMVVPLQPLMRISGRVMLNGRPASSARVELAGGFTRGTSGSSPSELRTHFSSRGNAMDWLKVAPNGYFEFTAFQSSGLTYRLHAKTNEGLAVEKWFTLSEFDGELADLGELNLQATGSVDVSLTTPTGVPIGGVAFLLDLSHGSVLGVPDSNGQFGFTGVVPGKHTLLVRKHPGISSDTPAFQFEVTAGQTSKLPIDLRPFLLAYQDLVLLEDGSPLADCKVYLSPSAPFTQGNRTAWKGGYFGTTDKNGRVHGKVPAAGWAEIWVIDPGHGAFKRLAETRTEITSKFQGSVSVTF